VTCERCGHDPDAQVRARWSFFVSAEVKSLNAHRGNYGAQRWAYKADRSRWQQWFAVLARNNGIPVGDEVPFRRVVLTRIYSGRQREFDVDNLAGGCKVVVDAMVRAGLLRGDDKASAQVTYRQRKITAIRGSEVGLLVELEELA
jgi:hypothetical protein